MSKVIFVNRYFFPDHSATSQILSDVCFGLAEQGFDVTVITGRQRYNAEAGDEQFVPAERVRGVSVQRVWSTRFRRGGLGSRVIDFLSFYVVAFLRVLKLAKKGDVVVALTDPPLLGVPLALAAKLRGAKFINWLHDVFPEIAEALDVSLVFGPIGKALRWLRDCSCRVAVSNVVIGERMAGYLEHRGIGRDQLSVIPNWAPEGLYPVERNSNTFREEWNLEGAFVVGYSGNLGRPHEWQTILAAAKALKDHPGVRFLLIGGGVGLATLRDEAKEVGLDNVMYKPHQPRESLSESLSAIDLHLISLHEGVADFLVPSKVYGIAAVGRPALFIGPAESEITDLLTQCGSGRQIEIGDADTLVSEILTVYTDALEYAARCKCALRSHREHYTLPVALRAWVRLLATCELERRPVHSNDFVPAPLVIERLPADEAA